MSRISIQGDSSGTGTLTIAAPNTNSNYTLTLPEATGTIITKDGSNDVTLNDITAGGIYLGGTGAANKLDDYEEGTFTPQWYGASTAGTPQNANLGRYTKIGQTVHVAISFDSIQAPTGGSGALVVSGLPFALKSGGPYNYPVGLIVLLGGGSALTPRMVSLREAATSTTFYVQYHAGSMNNDVTNITVSDLGSSNYLRASFSYTTDS